MNIINMESGPILFTVSPHHHHHNNNVQAAVSHACSLVYASKMNVLGLQIDAKHTLIIAM